MFLEVLETVTGVFVVIYDGQHGLKFTLGRARAVRGPGLHWKWPIVQRFRVEETKHTTLDLEPQVIQLGDDLVYEVDCKVVYRIFDLRKALIEIDDLVVGLRNRVVMAVQRVIQSKDRESVKDTDALVEEIRAELEPVGEQWGVVFLQIGFSNLSPSPATLEITQLELLAREKLALFHRFREQGLGDEAAVALISGAVISLDGEERVPGRREQRREEQARVEELRQSLEAERAAERARRETEEERRKREAGEEGDEEDAGEDGPDARPGA